MSETEMDVQQIEKKVSALADEINRIRDNQATRDDVVVDMKQAARARLELLAKDLQPVFNDVPKDNDQFEFALTSGELPRLWIDMTSFVRMGRDRRSYEFVKDTRMGRTILGQSDDRAKMAKMVTSYVAERMIERERIIDGEWVSMRHYDFGAIADEEIGAKKESDATPIAANTDRPGAEEQTRSRDAENAAKAEQLSQSAGGSHKTAAHAIAVDDSKSVTVYESGGRGWAYTMAFLLGVLLCAGALILWVLYGDLSQFLAQWK